MCDFFGYFRLNRRFSGLGVAAVFFSILVLPLQAFAHPDELLELIDGKPKQTIEEKSKKEGKPLWEIDAKVPFIGSPVHENMTISSVSSSNIGGRPFETKQDEAYIHGVFFNDDPENLLCPNCSVLNPMEFERRWGIAFGLRFQEAQKKVHATNHNGSTPVFKVGDGLLERSHFGDLQFWHGMAAVDGETTTVTQDKILAWAEFTYKVATGQIRQKTKLNQIPIESIKQLFIGDPKLENKTIEQLFRGPNFARHVAIGSLLHMIQDSYAPGHVDREILDYTTATGEKVFKRGYVKEFHCYTNQDTDKHKADDLWPDGLDRLHPKDELNPIFIGAKILIYMHANDEEGAPWDEVKKYLQEVAFNAPNRNVLASPGEKYRKQ